MAELEQKGTERGRKMYVQHGMPPDRVFGVSVADLKVIMKSIKGNQVLAYELYATHNVDAMYLAGMIADGSKMSPELLDQWAVGAIGAPMIAEYPVPWVTVENSKATEIARKWIGADEDQVQSSGWCTFAGLATTKADGQLNLSEIEDLLKMVAKEINTKPNRAKLTMNGFVIAVGACVTPLHQVAMATADEIGAISVDMGGTACKVRLASEAIQKAESAGQVGKKRKTIRC